MFHAVAGSLRPARILIGEAASGDHGEPEWADCLSDCALYGANQDKGVKKPMHHAKVHVAVSAVLLVSLGALLPVGQAANYTVHITDDIDDGTCGADGSFGGGACSLREAVKSANASLEADTIILFGNTFPLTLAGGDQSAVVGDLDIRSSDLTIRGAGAGNTIIDGSGIGADSIFTVDTFLENITVLLEDLSIQNAGSDAVANYPTANLTLTRCVVAGSARRGISNRGMLTVDNSVIETNRHGGIFNFQAGKATITDSIIRNNSTSNTFPLDGGGIFNEANGGWVTLVRTQVLNNTAARNGGGAWNLSSTLTIIDSVFDGNRCSMSRTSSFGGAIANSAGTVNITGSTLSNNSCSANFGNSGAINNGPLTGFPATVRLTNTTVSGNTGFFFGGIKTGSGFSAVGTLILSNCTVTNNNPVGLSITPGSGTVPNPATTVRNSIIAGNIGGDVGGPVSSLAFSITSGNPGIGPLANNGGPTLTHALQLGSPAIDGGDPAGCTDALGNPLSVDQRGVFRPQDGDGNGSFICDIGAVESNDCNGNGFPDAADVANGTSPDCNGNGFPDECDIGEGTSQDTNGNGVPDECETPGDLNGDGSVDLDDFAAFADCVTGIGGGVRASCEPADSDSDNDIDLADFGAFQVLFGR